jgi:hypothetical protein
MISEKGLFGMLSGVLSTVLLQPFENIKMALMLPPRELAAVQAGSSPAASFLSSCRYIY